jgi:broad specificity phosphatase PhoE
MAQRTLYLVRHGRYDWESPSPDKFEGSLTDLGRQQAALTGRRLRTLPIDVIHHSTLRRARETAAIIAAELPGVPVHVSQLLCECIPYVNEALLAKWFAKAPRDELEAGGRQAEQAYGRYFKPARGADRHEIIVCHGNIIRYFMCRVLQAPPEVWINADINNCGITEVRIEPNGWMRLVSHNDTGHLPYEMRS